MKIKPTNPNTPNVPTAIADNTGDTQQPLTLPLDGFSRASQLLPFLPIGESTLWKWCKDGKRFPKPVKLSPTITAWANKDVHKWFKEQYERGNTHNPANDDDYNDTDNDNDFDGVA